MLLIYIMTELVRKHHQQLADARASEREALRYNPANPTQMRYYSTEERTGKGATPSMGLSQFRGGGMDDEGALQDQTEVAEMPRSQTRNQKFALGARRAQTIEYSKETGLPNPKKLMTNARENANRLVSQEGGLEKPKRTGKGATPSMGLSQIRGGKHTLIDHLEHPTKGYGSKKKVLTTESECMDGGAQTHSYLMRESYDMGRHLRDHLDETHGKQFGSAFHAGMSGGSWGSFWNSVVQTVSNAEHAVEEGVKKGAEYVEKAVEKDIEWAENTFDKVKHELADPDSDFRKVYLKKITDAGKIAGYVMEIGGEVLELTPLAPFGAGLLAAGEAVEIGSQALDKFNTIATHLQHADSYGKKAQEAFKANDPATGIRNLVLSVEEIADIGADLFNLPELPTILDNVIMSAIGAVSAGDITKLDMASLEKLFTALDKYKIFDKFVSKIPASAKSFLISVIDRIDKFIPPSSRQALLTALGIAQRIKNGESLIDIAKSEAIKAGKKALADAGKSAKDNAKANSGSGFSSSQRKNMMMKEKMSGRNRSEGPPLLSGNVDGVWSGGDMRSQPMPVPDTNLSLSSGGALTGQYLGQGKKRNARAELVKKIMKEKGLKMIEASKYVKAHGLYK